MKPFNLRRDAAALLGAVASAGLVGCWPPLDDLTVPPVVSYRDVVLSDAPLGYWRLEEKAGATTAHDETTAHHDAAYEGAVTFAAGVGRGGVAALDGQSARIVVGDLFDFPGNTSFTIEAWIKPSVLDAEYRRVFAKGDLDANGLRDGYELVTDQGVSGLLFQRRAAGEVQAEILDVPAPSTATFTHVVVVCDGHTVTLFVNGAIPAHGVVTFSGPAVATGGPFVWGSTSAGSSFFAGLLDELAVYDTALPAARVSAHFQAGNVAP